MRWLASICALFIGASVSGCAIIEAEKHNRGGFLDQMADDHWMQADSKKMRALRAVAIEASLARIAMIAPKSAPDRALLARRIGETSKRADVVRRCAFSELRIPGRRSDEPCFFFDSVMVDYENALFDLAIIALPVEEAKTLMTRVTGGIAAVSLNPLELVQTLIDIGRQAFRYGRIVGAIYRDTLELEVQVWLASPDLADVERARGVPEQFVVTDDKVAGLRAAYVRGNDNIPAWRAAIAALRAQGLEPVPDQRFITEIFAVLTYFCGQIVTEKDPAYDECKQSALMQNMPVATGPGGRLSGSGAGADSRSARAREQELRDQLRRQGQQQQALETQLEELKKKQAAQGQPPQPAQPDKWAPYRATLCVTDETTPGPKMLQALKLFRAAINDKPAASFDAQLTETEISRLEQARLKFNTCRRGMTTPPRNPFEVGLYTFNSAEDVNGVLREALAKAKRTKPDIYSPGPNEALDMNRAIPELRAFYRIPPSAGISNAELDDRIWLESRK